MAFNKNLYKQLISKKLGDNGCYFLSIVGMAEKITGQTFDVVQTYDYALSNGWIGSDCYVERPDLIFYSLTAKKATIRKEYNVKYEPKYNEFLIGCFERKEIGATFYHFVLLDSKRNVIYDPYGESLTVKKGKLTSLRVFTVS